MKEAGLAPGAWQIARSLGHLIPYMGLSFVGIGISMPRITYLGLNFFARQHTTLDPGDIHCESSMEAPYCRDAVLDHNRMMMALSLVNPITQLVALPAVGVLSDTWGRRWLLIGFHGFTLLQFASMLLFLLSDTSLYWYYAFAAVTPNACMSLGYSVVMDLIKHHPSRSVGVGLLETVAVLGMLVGSTIGCYLPMLVAIVVAFTFEVAAFLYLALFLPESLQPEQRKLSIALSSLVPGVELRILWRSRLLAQLTMIVALSVFLTGGFSRIAAASLQRQMDWTEHESALSSVFANVSTIVCLGLLFQPLMVRLGEVGILVFSGYVGTFNLLLFIFATRPWQVLALTLLCAGPAAIGLPAISGMNSSLVAPREQGTLVAAFNTLCALANSAGVLCLGAIFDAANRPLGHGHVNKTAFWLALAASLAVLGLLSAVPRTQAARRTVRWAAEDSLVGDLEAGTGDARAAKGYSSVA